MNSTLPIIARGIAFLLLPLSAFGQLDTTGKTDLESIRRYKQAQRELDHTHSGIGVTFYKPALGKIVTSDKSWVDINVLSNFLEMRFGFGKCVVNGIPKSDGFGDVSIDYDHAYLNAVGYNTYVGVNFTLPFLTFGRQLSPTDVFRGTPTVSGGLGYMNFADRKDGFDSKAKLMYLSVNPGYRVRVPFGSIEANLNFRLGLTAGENDNYFNGSGIYPSITARFDGLMWKYNPDMVSVPMSMVTVTNASSTTTHTGTTYTSTSRIDTYTTTYTGDVHVTNSNVGIINIGPHVGIGPKISFMNPRRETYIPTGKLFGVVAEGRFSAFDIGFTIEGGKVGHGGKLVVKDEEENTYRKKLYKKELDGQGTLNTFNVYTQLGFDVTSGILAPLGIVLDKGDATSFFAFTAGVNLGVHFSGNQRYINAADEQRYLDAIANDEKNTKPKYLSPAEAKAGFLGGVYFSAQAGAMCFKITNYRYYGAPFASTTMLSLAYRIPILTRH